MRLIVNHKTDHDGRNLSCIYYLMDEGGNAFCKIKFNPHESYRMEFWDFNVDESKRHQGFGDQMLDSVFKWTKSKGCRYLYLYVESKKRWIAEWYKRKGFMICNYDSIDDSIEMYRKM